MVSLYRAQPSSRGLTLLELLVAVALSGALAAAVLGFTGQQLSQIGEAPKQPRLESAIDLMTWDYRHADEFRMAEDALIFQTRCGVSPTTGQIDFAPTEVTYRLQNLAEKMWLTRTQGEVTQTTHHLVAPNIVRVQIGEIIIENNEPATTENKVLYTTSRQTKEINSNTPDGILVLRIQGVDGAIAERSLLP